MNFADEFVQEAAETLRRLDVRCVERVVELLAATRAAGGRVFVLGVGGSAAQASHFVNDLRKLAAIEAYTPTDNVSELTARVNDDGWATCFEEWLKGSRLRKGDAVFVFSVGGGDAERNISPNLVQALQWARQAGARILGVVGRDGGYTAKVADACVVIPTVNPARVTPHTEAFHSVVGHLIISHPGLQAAPAKWESAVSRGKEG
jgi:D-sedoheptulose 7-phosphate isomerase